MVSFYPISNRIKNQAIRIVHGYRIKRCQIDTRRGFRIVPHALTDDRQRHIFTSGDTGPSVARHVHRQRGWQVKLLSYFLQTAVDIVRGIQILFSFVLPLGMNDGQEKWRGRHSVFINHRLHLRLPVYHHLLPRLVTTII